MEKSKKNKYSTLLRLLRKKWIAIVCALLIIVIGGCCIYVNFIKTQKVSSNEKIKVVGVYKQATEIVKNKGIVAGQAFLDEKLKENINQNNKADIYAYKASLASSYDGGNNIEESLKYLYEAEKLAPTMDTASSIASAEDHKKNSPAAIKYYKLYLERAASLSGSDDYQYYSSRLTALEKVNK